MNLGQLIDFVGNLLDYDPSNDTYRTQLVSLLNDSQVRVLTDRPWEFATFDRKLRVFTDTTLDLTFTDGSDTITGTAIPVSTDTVLPGSDLAGALLTFEDSGGKSQRYTLAWVKNGTTAHLDTPYAGTSGTYTVTIKRRDVYLPSDCMQVQNVSDPHVGVPAKSLFLSRFEMEEANLDPAQLGTIEAYLPAEGKVVPAPKTARGITKVVGVSQGVRTINVYMVNVTGPAATNFPVYPVDVSDGWESAFSKVATYSLGDTETLTFQPEALDPQTGLWRRYYFTCPEADIIAPVRIRNADDEGGVAIGVDTVPPDNPAVGGLVLKPDLSLSNLSTQGFQASSVRYRFNQSAAYQAIRLYPHVSGDQDLDVRMLINAPQLQEDQDAPLVPHAYAQLIAYAALESLALKVDNPALSAVYARKRDMMYRGMEQAYLQIVPRRIVKGLPAAGYRFVPNPFGKLTFT